MLSRISRDFGVHRVHLVLVLVWERVMMAMMTMVVFCMVNQQSSGTVVHSYGCKYWIVRRWCCWLRDLMVVAVGG